jgi:hypothetical protein
MGSDKYSPEEFAKLSPTKRFLAIKWWAGLIFAGFIALLLSLFLNSYLDKQQTAAYYAEQHLIASKCLAITTNKKDAALLFAYIETYYTGISTRTEKIEDFRKELSKGKSLDDIVKEDRATLPKFYDEEAYQRLFKSYEGLFDSYLNNWPEAGQVIPIDSHAGLIQNSFAAQKGAPPSVPNRIKENALTIILAVLALVYFGALVKTFFSSNPQNMSMAVDLVKTLTGFFIGVATSLITK